MDVSVYRSSDKEKWDKFVARSKQGTFLFYRDFMDYHQHRFQDHSLLVRERGRLVAMLPANVSGDVLTSHAGLTYGGFVTDKEMKVSPILEVFEGVLDHVSKLGIKKLIYKAVPRIYHIIPADEDVYALFRFGARLYRRDMTTVAMPAHQVEFQNRRKRGIKRARKARIVCRHSVDYERFWKILKDNLWSVHKLKPVHSLDEIRLLQSRFPRNIKLVCSFRGDEMVAGVVIFETCNVAHAQYTATSEKGRSCGALDLLFKVLLDKWYNDVMYFDFGVSTEAGGRYLNRGLTDFKEGFGGRAVTCDFYEIQL